MISFTKSIHIDRPQEEVFDYLSDPSNDSEWRSSAVSSEWITEGPPGVGSQLKSVDRMLGREMESTSEITAWDPPHKLGQKAMGGPVPFEFTVTLEPHGDATHVTIDGQAEIGGFFKIAEGLAGKQFEKQIETDIAGLKRVLEGGEA